MKVGDFVKFADPNGSIGKIVGKVHHRTSGVEWVSEEAFHVEWVYGRDVRGEVMKSVSRYVSAGNLQLITEKRYLAMRDREGWGDEKK